MERGPPVVIAVEENVRPVRHSLVVVAPYELGADLVGAGVVQAHPDIHGIAVIEDTCLGPLGRGLPGVGFELPELHCGRRQHPHRIVQTSVQDGPFIGSAQVAR